MLEKNKGVSSKGVNALLMALEHATHLRGCGGVASQLSAILVAATSLPSATNNPPSKLSLLATLNAHHHRDSSDVSYHPWCCDLTSDEYQGLSLKMA